MSQPSFGTPTQPHAARTIPLGVAVNYPNLTGPDARYRDTLAANFAGITPENEMKWDTIEPTQGVFNFGPADAIVSYALAHGMTVHGHNLVWDQQLPTWLTSASWSRDQLEAILRAHILAEVSHFKGSVHEWDVINEPFNDDGSLQQNIWSTVIGPDYIPMALTWAHEADPTARLFINEYNIDWPGPKQQAMVTLLDQLRQNGVPIDGVGMEEHLSLQWSPSSSQLTEAMQSYADRGLRVELTEADVAITGFADEPSAALVAQGAVYRKLAEACRAQPACVRFSVWGVSDRVSWLGPAAAGLPFDTTYEAKPAWGAILAGLANPGSGT